MTHPADKLVLHTAGRFYLFLLVTVAVTQAVRNICPSVATAGSIYRCQDRQLTAVPDNIPIGITTLDLSNNKIEILHEDNFREMESLLRVILDNNTLWKITEYAFRSLRQLKELSLSNNNFVIQSGGLSSSAFAHLAQLEILDLSKNPLGTLPTGFFMNHPELKVLRLDQAVSGLRIESNAFQGLRKLRLLSLTNNRLTSISQELAPDLVKMDLTTLYLDGNNWGCDCRLKWLKLWISKRNNSVPVATTRLVNMHTIFPKCNQPTFLKGRNLFSLNITEFQCMPQIYTRSHARLTVQETQNVTLSCSLYSDPKSYVKWYKNNTWIIEHWDRFTTIATNGNSFEANLTITNIRKTDKGIYRCETRNTRGSVSAKFVLDVIPIYSGLKSYIIIVLTCIAGSGLIVLLAAIVIIVYCFYGRDLHKRPPDSTIDSPTSARKRQTPRISITADGETTAHLTEHVKDTAENSANSQDQHATNTPKKRVLINVGANGRDNEDTSRILDDCPVHGSRLSYSPCPVHGTIQRQSSSQQQANIPNKPYPTLPQPTVPIAEDTTCPVHGTTMTAASKPNRLSGLHQRTLSLTSPPTHQQQASAAAVTGRTTPQVNSTFVRASKVDDCLSYHNKQGKSSAAVNANNNVYRTLPRQPSGSGVAVAQSSTLPRNYSSKRTSQPTPAVRFKTNSTGHGAINGHSGSEELDLDSQDECFSTAV